MRRLDSTLLLICFAILGATVLYPAAGLLWRATTLWYEQGLSASVAALWHNVLHCFAGGVLERLLGPAPAPLSCDGFAAVWNTIVQSLAAVITAGTFGTALAFLLTRYAFPGRGALAALAYLPFALPPLVGVVSFWYLLGPDGFVPRGIERSLGISDVTLRGPWMILFIHTYSFYVFFYAMVSAALEGLDRSLVEAARTLGASRTRVFMKVLLPLLRPALVGAALLTFMSTAASFSAPLIFGDNYPMLSVQVYKEQQLFNHERALTFTVLLAVISLFGVALFRSSLHTGRVVSKGVRAPIRSKTGRVLAAAAAWGVIASLLVPHATILAMSFANHGSWYEQLFPVEYTFANYTALFADPSTFRPMLNSAWMSGLAACASLVIGLPAAYLIARRRPGSRWLGIVVMIPWALPATVIAMNLIVAFNTSALPLYNTVWMIPLAYFVRTIPLFVRMAVAAIQPFDASLIEAGRTLGASPAYCLRRIAFPILAPAIGAACVLAFVIGLGEFPASVLLYVPANAPISVKIFELWRGSGMGTAFAYSVLLMVAVAASFAVTRRLSSRPF